MVQRRAHEISHLEAFSWCGGALLFAVMFCIYPLKFMFDAGFTQFLSGAGQGAVPMTVTQLAHASAIYGLGFVALFVMHALLYMHAYRQRHDLGLKPLEVFDARSFAGQQIVSAAVGGVVVLIAVAAPLRLHFVDGVHSHVAGPRALRGPDKKTRKRFEAQPVTRGNARGSVDLVRIP